MKCKLKNKIIVILILTIILIVDVNAFTTNGTGKTFDFTITSGKNNDLSSGNFNTALVIGDITSVVNSSNFRAEIGFLRTTGYITGEACESNLECTGGYCCSSKCQSTSCPVEEEAEEAVAAAGAAGGGGGGDGFVPTEDFFIDKDLIRALVKQGGTYKTQFTIENTGIGDLSFNIDVSDFDDLLLLSDIEFSLAPDEIKVIDVTIFAREKEKPDIYSGNIRITANGIKKSLPVIIEVQAKEALFDINIKVLSQHKYLFKNESVIANFTLINVGDLKPVDVELYYAIRDIEGNDLTFGMETLAIYDNVFRLKELELPHNISFGTYMFYAKVSYGIETASAVDIFYVVKEKPGTCFDGIQNQEETGVDCGGPCKSCKKRFADFFKPLPLFIIFGAIIILFSITVFIILRKAPKESHKKHIEIQKIYTFIDSALSRGYKPEHVRTHFLSKGLPEKLVDMVYNKVVSDKLRAIRRTGTATRQRPKQVVKVKTIRLPKKLHKQVVDYINKAMDLGHTTNQIEELFLKVGWPLAEIRKHISDVLESRLKELNKK